MSKFWSNIVHQVDPYVPGEQPKESGLLKLNTNENPYGPSPKALEAIKNATSDSLRLYPDPESTELVNAIAKKYKVDSDQVFVGNGSDEVLAHAFVALLKQSSPILFPDISYSFYPVYCKLFGINYSQVPLDAGFEIDLDDYKIENGGIIFPNPNAPTSCGLGLASIEKLLQTNTDSVVVVDEAYVDFGAESAIALIDRFPNLLVVQTLSKSRSLAGLRVGFAIGQKALVDALNRVKNSFNSYPLDRLAVAGGVAALEDNAWLEDTCSKIVRSRKDLVIGLERLGFEVLPSQANFVFCRHPNFRGSDLAKQLRKRKTIVRHFDKPRIADFLRITVGTDSECLQLMDQLADIVNEYL